MFKFSEVEVSKAIANGTFISEREVVANCFPFNKVMTLKKPLTTSSGTFEAGTTVVACQVRKDDYYIDLYSANGSDYFDLEDKIDLSESPKDAAKRSEEIRKFAEEYFAVDTEKTKAFDSKLNSINPLTVCVLFLVLVGGILTFDLFWFCLNNLINTEKSLPMLFFFITIMIIIMIFFGTYLFIVVKGLKNMRKMNRECNLEDKDKVQKIISKI